MIYLNNEDKILNLLENILENQNQTNNRLEKLEEEVRGLRVQTKENTDMTKALKHATDEIDAKVTAMSFDVAKITGEMVAIKDDFTTVELTTINNWKNIVELKKLKLNKHE